MTIDELLSLAGLTANDEIPVWDAEAADEPTKKITAQNLAASVKTLAGLVGEAEFTEALADKASAIVDTASGAIASFPDGAAVPAKDVTIGIEPVQAGSGDPSPENVRPISGWTGANVARTGKNALDIANASIAKPSWYPGGWYGTTKNSKAGITQERGYMDGGAGGFSTTLKPGTTYTISWTYDKALANSCSLFCGSYNGTDQNILADNVTVYSNTNRFSYTFTVPSDSLEIVIRPTVTAAVQSSGQTYDIDYIQIEPGSTATAYEPFSGTTIPISWQSVAGTVYGGTLDVTSGVLTVDTVKVTYNGSSSSTGYTEHSALFSVNPVAAGYTLETTNLKCNRLKPSNYSVATDNHEHFANQALVAFYVSESVSDWSTYLTANPIEISYKIGVPQTYQLTATEVEMLLGENNVWADTGDSTVTYRADTKLYIQKINAPTDDDMIADAQIASGRYFIVGGNLYRSTTTIPAGDAITPGTNCILTNLADALNALNT